MRQIILDVETTGLSVDKGDRVIELCCLELIDYIPTGNVFHTYLNPQTPINRQAQRVHGITNKMLKGQPSFDIIVNEFLEFIGDDDLIAHNADFDLTFIHRELYLSCIKTPLKNIIIDSLFLSRLIKPSGSCSLDAMLKFYKLNHIARDKHNAIDDCKLLGRVYYMLTGGKQENAYLKAEAKIKTKEEMNIKRELQITKKMQISEEEEQVHNKACLLIKNSIWSELSE